MLSTVSTTGTRKSLASLTASAVSMIAAVAVLLLGGPSAALAAGAYFVPEDTEAGWNGTVATVSFREADVELESDETTISVKASVDVRVICTRGESIVHIRRSATALDVANYPISEDGTVAGTARLRLEVGGLTVAGYTCVTQRLAITAVLEDFWTGATHLHKS